MTGIPTGEQILLAYWTVGHVFSDLAIMIIEQQGIDAHSAVEAMFEIFSSTDAAKSAIATVVGLLVIGHP